MRVTASLVLILQSTLWHVRRGLLCRHCLTAWELWPRLCCSPGGVFPVIELKLICKTAEVTAPGGQMSGGRCLVISRSCGTARWAVALLTGIIGTTACFAFVKFWLYTEPKTVLDGATDFVFSSLPEQNLGNCEANNQERTVSWRYECKPPNFLREFLTHYCGLLGAGFYCNQHLREVIFNCDLLSLNLGFGFCNAT